MAPIMKYARAAAIAVILAPTALAGTLEKRMSYHDNVVNFSVKNGIPAIPNASFTVTDFSITDGQDPDGRNKCGDVRSFSAPNQSLSFPVGRKGKEKAASWWKTNIPDHQNTFNHGPDKLNFAFLGDFKMSLQTADKSQFQDCMFYGIALGQGHTGGSNNWWVGGKNCQLNGDKTVKCQGYTQANGKVYVFFRRGGNDVNTIEVTGVEYA